MQPSTATSTSNGQQKTIASLSQQIVQGRIRPISAVQGTKAIESPARPRSLSSSTASAVPTGQLDLQQQQQQQTQGSRHGANSNASGPINIKEKGPVSSEELIRNLETKVRKCVEQKRIECDKLKFLVAKKKEEVVKARLNLQDLIKQSEALGLHYHPSVIAASNTIQNTSTNNSSSSSSSSNTNALLQLTTGQDPFTTTFTTEEEKIEEESNRLQPIASISRRPLYSKHTNINELEAKVEKRVKEAHDVHRKTMVYEHIEKRLYVERLELIQVTNELKIVLTEKSHKTQELHKIDLVAAEAVSHIQHRIAQQKQQIAADDRKYKREITLRLKWEKEKAKFEKYYSDQLRAVLEEKQRTQQFQAQLVASSNSTSGLPSSQQQQQQQQQQQHQQRPGSTSVSKQSDSAHTTGAAMSSFKNLEKDEETRYREEFQRIGIGFSHDMIHPEEIIRLSLSHDELKHELDAKYEEEMEKITALRERIERARNLAREDFTLSKRGTTKKIETKEVEIANAERTLATIIEQYMYVEQTVRPIKMGLQQIIQNLTMQNVDTDDMAAIEKAIIEASEELMRLMKEEQDQQNQAIVSAINSEPELNEDSTLKTISEISDDMDHHQQQQQQQVDPTNYPDFMDTAIDPDLALFGDDAFLVQGLTSPFNVRIPARQREVVYFPRTIHEVRIGGSDEGMEEEEMIHGASFSVGAVPGMGIGLNGTNSGVNAGAAGEDEDVDIMDRETVKLLANTLVNATALKRARENQALKGEQGIPGSRRTSSSTLPE